MFSSEGGRVPYLVHSLSPVEVSSGSYVAFLFPHLPLAFHGTGVASFRVSKLRFSAMSSRSTLISIPVSVLPLADVMVRSFAGDVSP